MAIQSLNPENPLYTSTVREFASGGSISVLRMRDVADAFEMGLGGLLVVVAAVLASASANLLPRVPLCLSTHRRVVGPCY